MANPFATSQSAATFGKGINNAIIGLQRGFSQPYYDAQEQYKKYYEVAAGYQMPFYSAGVNALSPYQQSLAKMQDPAEYYNSIMSGYNQSPGAQYQQQQAMNQATNAASASGLSGSTALMQQEMQTAEDISSKDMELYFSDIFGINKEYLSGLNQLIKGGQLSANQLTSLTENMMKMMGRSSALEAIGENKDEMSTLGGLEEMGMAMFGL